MLLNNLTFQSKKVTDIENYKEFRHSKKIANVHGHYNNHTPKKSILKSALSSETINSGDAYISSDIMTSPIERITFHKNNSSSKSINYPAQNPKNSSRQNQEGKHHSSHWEVNTSVLDSHLNDNNLDKGAIDHNQQGLLSKQRDS